MARGKQDFFSGGGEMGLLMRAYDWNTSALGSPEGWPQSLRTTVRILLTTQHPMFIWWGPDLIQFYNDAYRKTMGPERHPSALGQAGKACWQEIWHIIGPQITAVMRGEGATWHEDQLVPVTRHGKREDVWWTYSFGPIDDDNSPNGIGGVLVVCNDVTAHHRAFAALETSERRLNMALSAGVIGIWDCDVQKDLVFADERFARFYGVDPVEAARGAPIAKFLANVHPDDLGALRESVDKALKSGDEFSEEYRLVQADGSERWVLARGRCRLDVDGTPLHFSGAAVDITERKSGEAHRLLLTEELNHRSKNMLATMLAIANQTLRGDVTLAEARDKLTARVSALARAQDILLGRGDVGSEMEPIIRSAIEALSEGVDRFRLQGPELTVSPPAALAIAMALHELATNAAKYGSLSVPLGHVDISWLISSEGEPAFELTWRESGGPTVSVPKRKGFGSLLLDRGLTAKVGGVVLVDYAASGVVWQLRTDLQKLV